MDVTHTWCQLMLLLNDNHQTGKVNKFYETRVRF